MVTDVDPPQRESQDTGVGNKSADWSGDLLARKALRGALSLGARQVGLTVVSLISGVLLARLLRPADFGAFAVASFISTFLVTLADLGLGASLVRQIEEPSEDSYQEVFTSQLALIVLVAAAMFFAAPALVTAYGLGHQYALLLRLAPVSFVITIFQAIPLLRLERQLDFAKVGLCNFAQSLVFNGVAVALAAAGTGGRAFGYALVSGALVSTVMANALSRWTPKLRWNWAAIKPRLVFGIPVQATYFLSLVKDAFTPVLVGLLLGATQLGYIEWAGRIAAYSALALMALDRLYLPSLSRAQHDPALLTRGIEEGLRFSNAVFAVPALLVITFLRPLTVQIFGSKWLPALTLAALLWLAALLAPSNSVLFAALNAKGRSKVPLAISSLWMTVTWVSGVPLVLWLGRDGFGLATLAVLATNGLLLREARKVATFSFWSVLAPIWLAAVLGAIPFGVLAQLFPPTSALELAAYGTASALAITASILLVLPNQRRLALTMLKRSEPEATQPLTVQ